MSTACRFLFIIATLVRYSAAASCGTREGEYIWDGSTEISMPTNKTEFQENLNVALDQLPTNITKITLYNWAAIYSGLDPNAAYAQARCIGYVDFETCHDCIQNATAVLKDDCSKKATSAILWYGDNCMVRYSNHDMVGKMQMSDKMNRVQINSSLPSSTISFDGARSELLNVLAEKAEARPGDYQMRAAGKWYDSSSQETIYGVAQCSPDLYSNQCSSCFDIVGQNLESDFSGKVGGSIVGPSCNFRYEAYPFISNTLLFVDYSPTQPLPPSPPGDLSTPSPPLDGLTPYPGVFHSPSRGKGAKKIQLAIYIVAPILMLCVFLILIYVIFACLKKKKPRKITQDVEVVGRQSEDEINISEPHYIKTQDTIQYAFSTISAATENFSVANKLGQGGFGVVYKGKLQNGCEIAVKRLSETSLQGEAEFKTEVTLMANLQHRNLVRLLGFCLKRKERLLIYEFVANLSLDKFIFDPIKRAHLNWDRLNKIISGIARGLLYLHEDSRLRIIHRDLKSSNILLDHEMTPKIADFGMARLFVRDETHGNTSRIVGTLGYMAPEYAMHGQFSIKSDVFSFGVLLLEIVCGQRNSFFRIGNSVEDLLSYAWKNWQEGTLFHLIDPALLLERSSTHQMTRYIHIGLVCAQEDVTRRPTMASVVNMLSNLSIELPVPSKPAFSQQGVNNQDHDWSMTDKSDGSKDKSGSVWSTTEMQPR